MLQAFHAHGEERDPASKLTERAACSSRFVVIFHDACIQMLPESARLMQVVTSPRE